MRRSIMKIWLLIGGVQAACEDMECVQETAIYIATDGGSPALAVKDILQGKVLGNLGLDVGLQGGGSADSADNPSNIGFPKRESAGSTMEADMDEIGRQIESTNSQVSMVEQEVARRNALTRARDEDSRDEGSQMRAGVTQEWNAVYDDVLSLDKKAQISMEKIPELFSLVKYRAALQKAAVAKDYSMLEELLDDLKPKFDKRADRYSQELQDAEFEFTNGITNIEEEARPQIVQYFKDLVIEAKDTAQQIHRDIENGDAVLKSTEKIIDDFNTFLTNNVEPISANLQQEQGQVTADIALEKGKFETGMGDTLDKYEREEEETIDKLSEDYLTKVENEEYRRKGDGFENKGVIKEINDKWVSDQEELVTEMKKRIDAMTSEYTSTIEEIQPLMDRAEENTDAALDTKEEFLPAANDTDSDSEESIGGTAGSLYNGLVEKEKELPPLTNITENITAAKDEMTTYASSTVASGVENATTYMDNRIDLIKQRYEVVMRHLKNSEDNYTKQVPIDLLTLDTLLDDFNTSTDQLMEKNVENKHARYDELAAMEKKLEGDEADSGTAYTKKSTLYREDLKPPAEFLKAGFDKSQFVKVAQNDAARRGEYLNETETVMNDAERTQRRTIERKVTESEAFLQSQLEVAKALREAIEDDMLGVKKGARVQRRHINRLRVAVAEAAVMEKKLRTRVDPETEEMKNATAEASDKLREVALELNEGNVKAVRTEFANVAHIVDQEFAGLQPRLEHALALVKKRVQDAHDGSLPSLNQRMAKLKSMIAKAATAEDSVKQKQDESLQNIAASTKEMKELRKRMDQMKPEMLVRVKKAFAAMRSVLEEHIRDNIHGASARGQKAIEKAKALAAKLEDMSSFDVGRMGLQRVNAAIQLSEDAKKKAKLARDRAELVEEAAAGSMTDQLDRVAELTNSETGMGKDDLREISNLLASTQQNLRAESLRADAKAQKLRADVTMKSDMAERDLEGEGRDADSSLHSTDQDISGLVGTAASIVNAEAGIRFPDDGGLEGYSEQFAGITGMEGDVFQRLSANQHRLLSNEKQELAMIVGAVQKLAESFNEEFDHELAVEPHGAKDAAKRFGEANTRAVKATEDVLEEAKSVGDGRVPGVEATAEAAHDLAADVRSKAADVETGMEKLMKTAMTSTEFEHESEIHDLGVLVTQLESAFTPLPKLTDVLSDISSVEFDATHHLATLSQNTQTQKTRVDGILGAAEDAENGFTHIEDELDSTKPHVPVVPDMLSPDGAKSVDGLLVRMSGEAAALAHSAESKVADAFAGFGDSRSALLNKRRGLRDEVFGDVQEGAADESAVTAAMRSESVGDLTQAMGAEATAGEIYVNMEQTVNTLQDKLQRLTDSAVAFGKVAAVDVKRKNELLAAARQLEMLESKKNMSGAGAAAAAAAVAGANAGCTLNQTLSETTDECIAKPWTDFVGCAQEVDHCTGAEKNAWIADHCCKTCQTNCTAGFDKLVERAKSGSSTAMFVQTSDADALMLKMQVQQDMSKLSEQSADDVALRAREAEMDRESALLVHPASRRTSF